MFDRDKLRSMKILQKTCSTLALATLLLCGCSQTTQPSGGQAFAQKAMEQIGQNWDPQTLEQLGGPVFQQSCPPEKAREVCQQLKSRLGSLEKLETCQQRNHPQSAEDLFFEAPAKFQKGQGKMLVVVSCDKSGKWSVNGFTVDSPVLLSGAH